ncbi:hypothetical protein EV182_001957 [Spiromyces aspiralis]|uniref:Uncharacterized protein n=1 Tax=Spiromyces aspiralis TaxID=68401 RepID=A0ACC1HSF5_9FUNG|nr:hypothetical protein EV182_001957 [Spiromyces aspiralis]
MMILDLDFPLISTRGELTNSFSSLNQIVLVSASTARISAANVTRLPPIAAPYHQHDRELHTTVADILLTASESTNPPPPVEPRAALADNNIFDNVLTQQVWRRLASIGQQLPSLDTYKIACLDLQRIMIHLRAHTPDALHPEVERNLFRCIKICHRLSQVCLVPPVLPHHDNPTFTLENIRTGEGDRAGYDVFYFWQVMYTSYRKLLDIMPTSQRREAVCRYFWKLHQRICRPQRQTIVTPSSSSSSLSSLPARQASLGRYESERKWLLLLLPPPRLTDSSVTSVWSQLAGCGGVSSSTVARRAYNGWAVKRAYSRYLRAALQPQASAPPLLNPPYWYQPSPGGLFDKGSDSGSDSRITRQPDGERRKLEIVESMLQQAERHVQQRQRQMMEGELHRTVAVGPTYQAAVNTLVELQFRMHIEQGSRNSSSGP